MVHLAHPFVPQVEHAALRGDGIELLQQLEGGPESALVDGAPTRFPGLGAIDLDKDVLHEQACNRPSGLDRASLRPFLSTKSLVSMKRARRA